MPRYYCDYCDTYLTHDSQAGRKQHNRGWKHRENVKLYYDQLTMSNSSSCPGMLMTPGAWLRGPSPIPGGAPPRPGMFPPRGLPPRGMPVFGGPPSIMRPPPPFQCMPQAVPSPRVSIYGPQT